MSLPSTFTNSAEYCQKVIEFLKEFQWIFKASNTQFIADGILDQIPLEWIENLNSLENEIFNQLPFGYFNENWSNGLKTFFSRLNNLKPSQNFIISNRERSKCMKGINPKKNHEIENLTLEIYETCKTKNIDVFIDFGCGLGYLTQMLNDKYNYKILGIDGNLNNIKTALSRQNKFFIKSQKNVKYFHHFIEENSAEFLMKQLEICFNCNSKSNIGIIGMHACGDLTITALKLFSKIINVSVILIMPCCYHKMKMNSNNLHFENIPLSVEMTKCLDSVSNGYELITRPFLRLASQQTAARWKQTKDEHFMHGKNMFERALIDAILNDDEFAIKSKSNLKLENLGVLAQDYCTEFNKITKNYQIFEKFTKKELQWSKSHQTKFNNFIEKYPNGNILSEILTALQTCIQSLCENIVLIDKVSFMNEQSKISNKKINFYVKKIVDDNLSPRCFVFIGDKNFVKFK